MTYLTTDSSTENSWKNTALYGQHAFVWQYGKDLIQLLNPQTGEHILDLGCGMGQLTAQIAETGAITLGLDRASEMIAQARVNYPHLSFRVADARNFQVEQPSDAVFSNAALHWIREPAAVIDCIRQSLKAGGRFVAEFGGYGNVRCILAALNHALNQQGILPEIQNPWYFPKISEYATQLETQGFEVTHAVLFDRPTPLEAGAAGMANWLNMFANSVLADLSDPDSVIRSVEAQLRDSLYQDGVWVADYRRIRVRAIKL